MHTFDQRKHLTFKGNREKGRHGWLRLTPAYSLHLVEELIGAGGKGQRVLEPFCGTGTTPLVCCEQGVPTVAVDINPFLTWLAQVKCTHHAQQTLDALPGVASEALQRARRSKIEPPRLWLPPIKDADKWWNAGELLALGRLWACLAECDPGSASDLLRVAFCKAVIQVAKVSFGHQSMSFAADSAEGGLFPPEKPEVRVTREFLQAVESVVTTANARPLLDDPCRIVLGDSRDLALLLRGEKFTTVVTSPPYPNRMSYIRELRPYMYWLRFLQDGREAGELDWKAIGGTWGCATSNLNSWVPPADAEVPHPGFETILAKIRVRSPILARYVHKYFTDAVVHARNLRPVLARRARVHYVVGNSKFYDVMLPTEELYARIFQATGFRNVKVRPIRKRTSKKELFEFVVEAGMP